MKRLLMIAALALGTGTGWSQDYREDLKDCITEKDAIYIDWENEINKSYVDRKKVEQFSQKRLRAFYCQNLVAKDRLESDGVVVSRGGFEFSDDDLKYLVFSLNMGDLTYEQKLYIHIGPRQKLVSIEN